MTLFNVERNIKRAGNILPKVLQRAKQNGAVSGKDALEIFNSYGIGLDVILLIAHSHNLSVNEKEFKILLHKQETALSKLKQKDAMTCI